MHMQESICIYCFVTACLYWKVCERYHHFREYVERQEIEIYAIKTTDQQADILTKNLPGPTFARIRDLIMGW